MNLCILSPCMPFYPRRACQALRTSRESKPWPASPSHALPTSLSVIATGQRLLTLAGTRATIRSQRSLSSEKAFSSAMSMSLAAPMLRAVRNSRRLWRRMITSQAASSSLSAYAVRPRSGPYSEKALWDCVFCMAIPIVRGIGCGSVTVEFFAAHVAFAASASVARIEKMNREQEADDANLMRKPWPLKSDRPVRILWKADDLPALQSLGGAYREP